MWRSSRVVVDVHATTSQRRDPRAARRRRIERDATQTGANNRREKNGEREHPRGGTRSTMGNRGPLPRALPTPTRSHPGRQAQQTSSPGGNSSRAREPKGQGVQGGLPWNPHGPAGGVLQIAAVRRSAGSERTGSKKKTGRTCQTEGSRLNKIGKIRRRQRKIAEIRLAFQDRLHKSTGPFGGPGA